VTRRAVFVGTMVTVKSDKAFSIKPPMFRELESCVCANLNSVKGS
jgi:hypothetical protein